MLFCTPCDVSMRPFPTVSSFFRVGHVSQTLRKWTKARRLGLTPFPVSSRFDDVECCLRWLGWFPNSMHCTRFRKPHLGALAENAQKIRGDKGSKGSWVWTLAENPGSLHLGETLSELSIQPLDFSSDWVNWMMTTTFSTAETKSIYELAKMHENPHQKLRFLDVAQSPPNELHTMSAHVTPAMQIFTLLSLSAAQINWLLSSSSQAAETCWNAWQWRLPIRVQLSSTGVTPSQNGDQSKVLVICHFVK